jgi:uncharacterized DUF497 family protein
MKIVWDEPNRLANLDKHGLDFADLNETFLMARWFAVSPQALDWHWQRYPWRDRRGFCRLG